MSKSHPPARPEPEPRSAPGGEPAAVKTSAQIAVERAAAMAAGSGLPSHDSTPPVDDVADFELQVARLMGEVEQMRDSTLRARADFENTRKRLLREKEEGIRYANGTLVERLLPVLDSFELGLAEARKHKEKGAASIVQGFELVYKQMAEFLKDQGVEPIDAEGQPFDPNLHQALGQQESDLPEGRVSVQVRKGYKLRERLLRPAMVFVSKGPAGGV